VRLKGKNCKTNSMKKQQ